MFSTLERLLCHLYGTQTVHGANNIWYKKFSQGKTPDQQQLPPTHDKLQQNVKRCNYHYYVWKQSLLANPDIPSPSGHGWLLRDDLLKIQWIENQISAWRWCANVENHACRDTCQSQNLGLECADLYKCSGNSSDETEVNDIEAE